MTDRDIAKILSEALPLAAVLVRGRGGWLTARGGDLLIEERFPGDGENPALWRIDMRDMEATGPASTWYAFYTRAEDIMGISVRRHDGNAQREGTSEEGDQPPGEGPG